MAEEKPHEHIWGYKGLEYETGRQLKRARGFGTRYERSYLDVFICSGCLTEKLIPRYLGHDTSFVTIEGSTPRSNPARRVIEEPEEEERTPIDPKDRVSFARVY